MWHGDVIVTRGDCRDCLKPSEMEQRNLLAVGMYRQAPNTGLIYRVALCELSTANAQANDTCRCSRPFIAGERAICCFGHSASAELLHFFVQYGIFLPMYAIYHCIDPTFALQVETKWYHAEEVTTERGRRRCHEVVAPLAHDAFLLWCGFSTMDHCHDNNSHADTGLVVNAHCF